MNMKERPSDEFIALLKQSGSSDKAVAIEAQREIAKALETPLRKGVLFGDVVTSIYEAMPLEPGATPEFPLDLLAPGTESEHIAYTQKPSKISATGVSISLTKFHVVKFTWQLTELLL